MLSLRDLKAFLCKIERRAAEGADVGELAELVRLAHDDYWSSFIVLDPGTTVWRAVKVDLKPRYRRRLIYPPPTFCPRNGRLNAAGTSIFYGSLNSPVTCLRECRAAVGDVFAIGRWTAVKPLTLNHMGYSSEGIRALPAKRTGPFTQAGLNHARTAMLREWQSRIFTMVVPDGEEHRYSLSIALSRVACMPVAGSSAESWDAPTFKPIGRVQVSGMLYPSVAASLINDNVAIAPSVVDSSLRLSSVTLEQVQTIQDLPVGEDLKSEAPRGRIGVHVLDTVSVVRQDGRLVWNGESTALSLSPWPRRAGTNAA